MSHALETLIGGLLSGMMYSLVAIGFVLIFKASGVFNYAQGAMLLFSALFFVTMLSKGMPFIVALLITIVVIVIGAIAIERIVLRPLANSSAMTLFMATLGLSYVIEGLAQGNPTAVFDAGLFAPTYTLTPSRETVGSKTYFGPEGFAEWLRVWTEDFLCCGNVKIRRDLNQSVGSLFRRVEFLLSRLRCSLGFLLCRRFFLLRR